MLEAAGVGGGFDLLQLEVLRGAGPHGHAVNLRPEQARARHDLGGLSWRPFGEPFEFADHALVEAPQLANHFGQPEPLLPPVQPVRRCIAQPLGLARLRAQVLLKSLEHCGNVVVELGVRQGIAAGQRGIGRHRSSPCLQDGVATGGELVGQCVEWIFRGRHRVPSNGWAANSALERGGELSGRATSSAPTPARVGWTGRSGEATPAPPE